MEKDAIWEACEIISPSDFYVERHQIIFEAIVKLNEDNIPSDLLTVTNHLKKGGSLDNVGGAYYLTELMDSVASSGNVEHYSRIVREKSILRGLIETSTTIATKAYDESSDAFDLMDFAEESILKVRDEKEGGGKRAGVPVKETLDWLESIQGADGGVTGIPSGLGQMDRLTSGWQPTDFVIIAARPSMGKTAASLKFMKESAKRGFPAAIFSMEMDARQLTLRLLTSESGVDSQRARTGRMTDSDWTAMAGASGRLKDLRIFIDDTPALTPMQLRAKARRLVLDHGVGLIIVDYMQLMRGSKGKSNREQEIAEISRSLKALAKELNITVIALSQLSRAVELRGDKRPQLSDLRESGCLSGDTVIHSLNGLVNIRDLDGVNNFRTFAFSNYKTKAMKAKKAWKTGTMNVKKLVLTTGHNLVATGNHMFLTNDGWLPLEDISINHHVAIPINYNGERTDYNEDLAYLMGAMIANGKAHKRQAVTYTCNSKDIAMAEDIKRISEENFDCVSRVVDNRPKYNWINTYIKSKRPPSRRHRNPFVVFMEEQGIYDKRAHNKTTPPSIFRQDSATISSLLAGLYDNDGSIMLVKCKKRTIPAIHYSTASIELANNVQLLLQMIGVVSRIKRLSRDRHVWYHIAVTGADNMITFCNRVPLRSARKRLEVIKILDRLSKIKHGWTKDYKNESKSLAFIEVKSITDMDLKEGVYDIEVPGAHNFVANGVLAHNSLEQDADVVVFLYRAEYYGITIDENGNSLQGVCEMILAKQRNGPTGDVLTYFNKEHGTFESLSTRTDDQNYRSAF